MAPVTNGRLLFKEVPIGACLLSRCTFLMVYLMRRFFRTGLGYPVPGQTTAYDDSEKIDPETVALNGGFLLKTLVLSIDPYLRRRMRPANHQSYSVR